MPPVLLDQKVNRVIQADKGHLAFQQEVGTLTCCIYSAYVDAWRDIGDKQHVIRDESLGNFGRFSDKWDEVYENVKSIHLLGWICVSI